MDTLAYYSEEFWDIHGDPLTSGLAGMDSPWIFIAITLNLVLFCKVWGPMMMSTRQLGDLRPVYVVVNGLMFGSYAVGVLASIFFSDNLRGTFSCATYDPNTIEFRPLILKYLAYSQLVFKAIDFNIPILAVLSKRMDKVTNLQLIHLTVGLWIYWAGVKVNPGGIFTLIGVLDALKQSIIYGYLVMMSASREIRPKNSTTNKFFTFVLYVRVVSMVIALIHQGYFLFQDNCFTKELRVWTTAYIVLIIIFYPIDHAIRSRNRRREREKELLECQNSMKDWKHEANNNNNSILNGHGK